MVILAIETSCDDTCIAILKIKDLRFKILSNIVSSQVKIHAKYGGVYPTLAKREHQRNLPIVLRKSLKEAGFEISKSQFPNIDLIAVTVGPGLEPCLWTGVNFANDLSKMWKKPIIPVNHIEAHIFANFLSKVSKNFQFSISNFQALFPAICLIVSGGHTQLILMKDFGKYKILGETRDDAAGECFDKTARILGLGYPGGPAIAAEAAKFRIQNSKPSTRAKLGAGPVPQQKLRFGAGFKIQLPRPMIHQKNYDFSFSGLKTAVLYDFKNQPPKFRKSPKENLRFPTGQAKEYIRAMASEIQQAIIDVLIKKTIKAAEEFKVKSIILGGGVVANEELRKQFNYKLKTINSKLKFLVPPKNLCTDNAVMVAVAGYFHYLKGKIKDWEYIKVDANLRI